MFVILFILLQQNPRSFPLKSLDTFPLKYIIMRFSEIYLKFSYLDDQIKLKK